MSQSNGDGASLGAKPGRNAEILRRHVVHGESMAEIGRDLGITRERVRQIVRRAEVSPEVSKVVRRLANTVRWTCAHCGKVEMRRSAQRKARTYCSLKCAYKSGATGGPKKWTDDDLLCHLAMLALRLGRTPSTTDITEASPPDHTQYYRRFGSLTAAQERLGLTPNESGAAGHGANPLTAAFLDEWGDLLETPESP